MKRIESTPQPTPPAFIAAVFGTRSDPEFFAELLAAIPGHSTITYLVVDPPTDLQSCSCSIPIKTGSPGQILNAGEIVLLPDDLHLELHGDRLQPATSSNSLFAPLSTSNLLPSAAILVGSNWSDSLADILAIKAHGGIIITEPRVEHHAERTPPLQADVALDAPEIPPRLDLIAEAIPDKAMPHKTTPEQLRKLASLIKRFTGLDLASYKPESVSRRIARRLAISGIQSPSKYITYIQKNPTETELLAKEMLIGVTSFFRDQEVFARLRETVIPGIVSEAKSQPVRIWVPACATGEEVYSIAILFDDALREKGLPRDNIKIFATDLDQDALGFASRGNYPKSIVEKVPHQLLERYFEFTGNSFQIVRSIRERIVFAKHNALKDPPFTRLDLVSCRNLLIYLTPTSQQRVLNSIAFALRPGGTLVLGQSESTGDSNEYFVLIDPKSHIYYKQSNHTATISSDLQFAPLQSVSTLFEHLKPWTMPPRTPTPSLLIEAFTNKILSHTDKTCFVLNDQHEVLYSFGDPGKFTTLTNGRTSIRLPDLLPDELSIPLSTALDHVEIGKPVHFGPIPFPQGNLTASVNLFVETLRIPNESESYILTFIEEAPGDHPPDQTSFDSRQLMLRITELEQELDYHKSRMKSLGEELEASREELQTTNEELQAANEELQSTNEELESVNEELQTVNGEYQTKIHELTRSNEELDNFITSTDIATIFLDPDLRLRRFTPTAAKSTGLLIHDQGRLITEFSHPLLTQAHMAAKAIISGESVVEKSITHDHLGKIILRATPYILKNGAHAGATVSFIPVNL